MFCKIDSLAGVAALDDQKLCVGSKASPHATLGKGFWQRFKGQANEYWNWLILG